MAVGMAEGVRRNEQWHMERTRVQWPENAILALEKAERAQTDPALWFELGVALENAGFFREAVENFSKALIYDPFNAEYYFHRGHRYLSCGQVPAFTADFEMCLRLRPDDWWALYYIQEGFTAMGLFEQAERYSKRLWELTGEDTPLADAAAVWYCEALGRLGKWDEYAAVMKTPFLVKMMDDPATESHYIERLRYMAGRISDEEMFAKLCAIPEDAEHDAEFAQFGWSLVDMWYSRGLTRKADWLCARIAERDHKNWHLTAYFLAYFEAKRRGLIE